MIENFLTQPDFWNEHATEDFIEGTIGSAIFRFNPKFEIAGYDIALIGVSEERTLDGNKGVAKAPNAVRKYLYPLYSHFSSLKIIDLGDIKGGFEFADTLFALKATCAHLIKNDIIPVIIGGPHSLTYGQFQAYESLEQSVDMIVFDARFDLNGELQEEITNTNFLYKVIAHQPNYLFNLSIFGYQRFFVADDHLKVFEKLNFDAIRLGDLRNHIEDAEPFIRGADMLSMDMAVIRNSDAPGAVDTSPNGLFGHEACQLIRYAGMSDKMTSIGFYNYDPLSDNNGVTGYQIAQMIWYFMEGVSGRMNDIPSRDSSQFTRYTTLQNNGHELVFYKSNKSGRWWIEVASGKFHPKYERSYLVPCSYNDYQQALDDDLPEKWIKAHNRFTLLH